VELFGGYAYVGFGSRGYLTGALGSFGWNIKPWLQIVTDTSYSLVTPSGGRILFYGSHFGPRFFRRGQNKWGASPFIEALFGRSRLTTSISGPGGYQISNTAFSIKVGGGLDLNISPHVAIRLLNVDYCRTALLVYSQNNYWASAGIVLRLGAGRPH
jgi:hypothetical protein